MKTAYGSMKISDKMSAGEEVYFFGQQNYQRPKDDDDDDEVAVTHFVWPL